MRAVIWGTALIGVACAVAACSGGGATGGGNPTGGAPGAASASAASPALKTLGPGAISPGAHPAAAWRAFNAGAARTGVVAGLPAAGPLTQRWTAHLDGAVYGQPLVVGTMVIAATENDTVYALDSSSGKVVWQTHVGTPVPLSSLPCGNIDPLGITGTPVYDQGNGLVYAVAETTGYHHVLFGLAVSNGTVKVERDIPAPDGHPRNDQQRPALTIAGGRVYVAFGGLAGDCEQYIGSVVGIPLSGGGKLVSWHTPTSREGALWGTGGPVIGPGGDLWVSTGNGATTIPGRPYDGSDSVVRLRLTPDRRLVRVDFFAPATWAQENATDADLGSTQPVLAAGGSTFIMGKSATGYLLSTTGLGGIGHPLAAQRICHAYGAAAVDGSTVYEPCMSDGMAAIAVNAAQRKIRVLWRGPADTNGSPVAGGGAVWVTSYQQSGGSDSGGTLYELDPADGTVKSRLAISDGLPHFSSLSLAGGTAFLGTLKGVVAVNGV
jgi:polyvinyl alcohol dehydrogenase (cytochrome)